MPFKIADSLLCSYVYPHVYMAKGLDLKDLKYKPYFTYIEAQSLVCGSSFSAPSSPPWALAGLTHTMIAMEF